MKTRLIGLLIAASAAIISPSIQAVGFTQLQVPDRGEPALSVGLWYPSEGAIPTEPNTRFGMALAVDAPMGDTNGGLILLSHGYSGWYAGHADTAVALAEAGYIVAAPSHTGNTWSDMSSSVPKWLLDRPRHISSVIDHLLNSDSIGSEISSDKIGLYGFSAGGYTALSLIGGVPDFDHAKNHCRTHPQEYVCAEGLFDAMLDAKMDELPASAWGADERIQTVAIAAPGWGFAYPERSLSNVTADVQLWSGMLDESVPTDTNAAFLATQLPAAPETHFIENANHFAFLVMPCREAFKEEDPEEYEMVCGDAPGFDRYAFHTDMHKEMLRFFNDKLGINQ
jgi:predicted dienelactone hydrolase